MARVCGEGGVRAKLRERPRKKKQERKETRRERLGAAPGFARAWRGTSARAAGGRVFASVGVAKTSAGAREIVRRAREAKSKISCSPPYYDSAQFTFV